MDENITYSIKESSNQKEKVTYEELLQEVQQMEIKTFEGICRGQISKSETGKGGFGYDPLFIPDGYQKSFAELGSKTKNAISHRAKALSSLADFLLNSQEDK